MHQLEDGFHCDAASGQQAMRPIAQTDPQVSRIKPTGQ